MSLGKAFYKLDYALFEPWSCFVCVVAVIILVFLPRLPFPVDNKLHFQEIIYMLASKW